MTTLTPANALGESRRPPLPWGRRIAITAVVLLMVVLQTSFFSHLAWRGVVPDLAMLMVLAVAVARGPMSGMLVGFATGLLLDLAPPADHVAGRWALALVLVGLLAGTFGSTGRLSWGQRAVLVAACSFVATSVMALTGLLVDDVQYSVPDLLAVVVIALVLDLAAALVVLWWAIRLAGGATSERSLRGRR